MTILDAHHVKGTFFEVGKAIDADPQITRALYEDGQLLGNHSYHHDQWRWLDPRYPEPHYALARLYRRAGETEKADRALGRFQALKKARGE